MFIALRCFPYSKLRRSAIALPVRRRFRCRVSLLCVRDLFGIQVLSSGGGRALDCRLAVLRS